MIEIIIIALLSVLLIGAAVYVVSLRKQIVELQKKQEEANEIIANREKEKEEEVALLESIRVINHNIRSLFTLVVSPVQKLIASDTDPVRQRSYQLVIKTANRQLGLTEDMREIYKAEIDRLRPEEAADEAAAEAQVVAETNTQTQGPGEIAPAVIPAEAVEIAEGIIDASGNKSSMHHVLLVDDDPDVRQYIENELSSSLSLHLCANGQEALDYVLQNPEKVELVISDVMMPVMNGMSLCQRLKSNFNTTHIPIVLLTALGDDSARIEGLSIGADAYLSKPFNVDVLRSTVLNLLKSRHQLKGKFNADLQQEEKIERKEIESPDEHLMKRVMKVINDNLDNSELSVEVIADKVGISRVHFYRKMKDLTGQAPRDFLKYVRLKEAARMLAEKKIDITGVSVATGFKSLSAFSTNFKAMYGVSPKEYATKHSNNG